MSSQHFILARNGWVPNNPTLPVLIYRAAITDARDAAARFETLFGENGWPAQWRDGVFRYHHYHSTAHEALGVAGGSATLMVGGEGGSMIDVALGDVLVLPVGTGHCLIDERDGFLVVGAYPVGEDWDTCREAPSPEMLERMADLPLPAGDPVTGRNGPLRRLWRPTPVAEIS